MLASGVHSSQSASNIVADRHTVEIMEEYGFTKQQRAALREAGVFGEFGDE